MLYYGRKRICFKNEAMKYRGLDKLLQEKIASEDFLYIGYSAGSCVTGKRFKNFEQVDEPKKYYNKDNIFC